MTSRRSTRSTTRPTTWLHCCNSAADLPPVDIEGAPVGSCAGATAVWASGGGNGRTRDRCGKGQAMTTIKSWSAAVAIAVLVGALVNRADAQRGPAPQPANQAVAIDGDDSGGTITRRVG